MRKICPKCHREQQDERIIACEICKEPFISIGDGLRLLSKEEITALASAIFKDWRIRLLLKAFPVIVLVGVAGAALFLNWSAAKRLKLATEEIEKNASNEVFHALSVATNDIALQFKAFSKVTRDEATRVLSAATNELNTEFEIFVRDAKNQLANTYNVVTNQISETFREPNIRRTVENVAKDEARSILEAEVQPAVKSFTDDALFIRTVARAQAYDFKAYQGLLELGRGTNDNAKLARQVVAEINRSLARDRSQFSPKRTFVVFSGTNFYKGPFTSDELAAHFSDSMRDPTSYNREGFVNAVSDLKQPLFLPSLIGFFTNETDLGVADRLTIAISVLAKEEFNPHDFDRIQTWWHSHQNAYTNWPFAEFSVAMNHFVSGNHSRAFPFFQKVLELDSSADQSRAFSMVSSWAKGETNKMVELAKGFKQPNARWAQWGNAFAELQNGSVSNATVRFADLTKKQPTMTPFLPDEKLSAWSKIDWHLFRKLTSLENP